MAGINPLYPITELTQEQYDALEVKDANTLYAVPLDGVPPSHQMPDPGSTLPCVLITQEDYDSLGTYDWNTLYCIGHPEPTYDVMPYMDGITNYYDCLNGLTANSWKNQATNENDAVLIGAEIMQDGTLQIKCTSASYGYFDANISHHGSGSMCMYAVCKGDIVSGFREARSVAVSKCNPISTYNAGDTFAVGLYDYDNSHSLVAAFSEYYIPSNVLYNNYHVIAVNKRHYYRNGIDAYDITCYIDGVFIGELDNAISYPTGTKFGIGAPRDINGNFAFYSSMDLPTQIKMIAVGNTAHTADQVARNCEWLRSYYGLD